MPHDADGNLIKKGDRVTLHATVTEVYESESCNAAIVIDTPEGEPPNPMTLTATSLHKIPEAQTTKGQRIAD